jgi:hypothetical protein
MAGELTVTAAHVRLVRADASEIWTAPAGEAATAGQWMRQNTTTGYLELGNGSSTTEIGNLGGVVIDTVAVGEPATIALPGAIIDLGAALDGVSPGALVYLSDTEATPLATSAGTSTKVVGIVIMAFGSTGGDRLLRLGVNGA